MRKLLPSYTGIHIEGEMAFHLSLPLLLIRERGVEDGIFDNGVTDRFVHQINFDLMKDGQPDKSNIEKYFESEKFLEPLDEWFEEGSYITTRREILENLMIGHF